MKYSKKDYIIVRTKKHLKKNRVLFIYSGTIQVLIRQNPKTADIHYYKVFNRLALSTLESSLLSNIKTSTNRSVFFAEHCLNSEQLSRQLLFNNFELVFLVLLALKLNNKSYSSNQLKSLKSTSYKKCCLLLYQWKVTYLKRYFPFQI